MRSANLCGVILVGVIIGFAPGCHEVPSHPGPIKARTYILNAISDQPVSESEVSVTPAGLRFVPSSCLDVDLVCEGPQKLTDVCSGSIMFRIRDDPDAWLEVLKPNGKPMRLKGAKSSNYHGCAFPLDASISRSDQTRAKLASCPVRIWPYPEPGRYKVRLKESAKEPWRQSLANSGFHTDIQLDPSWHEFELVKGYVEPTALRLPAQAANPRAWSMAQVGRVLELGMRQETVRYRLGEPDERHRFTGMNSKTQAHEWCRTPLLMPFPLSEVWAYRLEENERVLMIGFDEAGAVSSIMQSALE
ncbi:MAG: hypothetical protein L0219_13305 [Phycisphaerales bacterium]|nr:hypothetical protein [Phycisphaerales bacterium]